MIGLRCDYCGKNFPRLRRNAYKSLKKRNSHYFCSTQCHRAAIRDNPSLTGNFRGGKKAVPCNYCGITIYRAPSQLREGKNNFCSRKCQGKWASENLVGERACHYQGKLRTAYCIQCGKEIRYYESVSRNVKYCSTECKAVHQRKRITVQCSHCGKELSIKPSRLKWSKIRGNGKIYCNKECHDAGQRGKAHPSWIDDRSQLKDPLRSARRSGEMEDWQSKVFERDNHVCQMCGAMNVPLVAHHLKGFTKYPELGLDLDNGQTLCRKCHRKAHKSMCCRRLVLSADDIGDIVRMRVDGKSLSQIEKASKVSMSHICNILNGKIKAYHEMLKDAGWTV